MLQYFNTQKIKKLATKDKRKWRVKHTVKGRPTGHLIKGIHEVM